MSIDKKRRTVSTFGEEIVRITGPRPYYIQIGLNFRDLHIIIYFDPAHGGAVETGDKNRPMNFLSCGHLTSDVCNVDKNQPMNFLSCCHMTYDVCNVVKKQPMNFLSC